MDFVGEEVEFGGRSDHDDRDEGFRGESGDGGTVAGSVRGYEGAWSVVGGQRCGVAEVTPRALTCYTEGVSRGFDRRRENRATYRVDKLLSAMSWRPSRNSPAYERT